jgi:hypothetical protein
VDAALQTYKVELRRAANADKDIFVSLAPTHAAGLMPLSVTSPQDVPFVLEQSDALLQVLRANYIQSTTFPLFLAFRECAFRVEALAKVEYKVRLVEGLCP